MKVLLLVFAIVAAVSAQTEPRCRCAAFITFEFDEMMVYEAPEIAIDSCQDDAGQCKTACLTELNTLSNNGDLWLVQENGVTVGQSICSFLANYNINWIVNHRVYGYFEVCGGPWEYAEFASQQLLCCDAGEHDHCIVRK
ncbi:uncharacterized protein LOC119583799 [Penaeus monodon]|uniref:uncharacterized protein LOC119583799 n=1 Tax=Penaeus monodon TaxID=6687 RepID=UPI0018A7CA68|nr:uncharacterized protein LOC119583799 [Penaeus monodon]